MKNLKVMHMISSRGMYGAENVVLSWMNQIPKIDTSLLVFASPKQTTSPLVQKAKALGFSSMPMHIGKFKCLSTTRKTIDFFRSSQPDIIQSHGYKGLFYGKILSWRTKTPLIHTNHGFVTTSRKAKFNTWVELFICRYFPPDQIIAVGENIQKIFISAGINPQIITRINNAVMPESPTLSTKPPTDLQKKMHERRVICYSGRLSYEKGPDLLIKAIPMVVKKFSNVLFILAGDGPMSGDIKRQIQTSGISNHVLQIGFRTDVNKIMATSQAVILPSRSEGIPLTMLEAMMLGKPIIGFAVGGIQETIQHRKTGILAQPECVEELANALLYVLENPNKAIQLGINARDLALKKYNLPQRMHTLVKLYQIICPEKDYRGKEVC